MGTGAASEVPRLRVHQDPGLPRGRLPGRPLPEVRAQVAGVGLTEMRKCGNMVVTNQSGAFLLTKASGTHYQANTILGEKAPHYWTQVDASPAIWLVAVGNLIQECGVFCDSGG